MEHPAYDAVFFDLDGTLLPMDVETFLSKYFTLLGQCAVTRGFEPKQFSEAMRTSVFSMSQHEPGVLNSSVFWETFEACLGPIDDATRAFFDEFYEQDFGRIGEGFVPDPAAARAVEALRRRGYPLYLTTMPMFPRPGVEWRLRWAGVDPAAFARITCYDNSTACKPSLTYYHENLEIADVPASRVLMVGNNTKEDLACLDAGMDAYLVTDYLLNPNDFDIDTVKHGSMAAFADFVETLPACTNAHALEGDPDRIPASADTTR